MNCVLSLFFLFTSVVKNDPTYHNWIFTNIFVCNAATMYYFLDEWILNSVTIPSFEKYISFLILVVWCIKWINKVKLYPQLSYFAHSQKKPENMLTCIFTYLLFLYFIKNNFSIQLYVQVISHYIELFFPPMV